MVSILRNRVRETTITNGTGTLSLAGAVTGFNTFIARYGDAQICLYVIEHATADEWEIVIGTVTAGSPVTLTRTSVKDSSNGGSAVSFSSGTKYVWVPDGDELMMRRLEVPLEPGGRLTPTTNTPVLTADATGVTSLRYTQHQTNWLSLHDGYRWGHYQFPSELDIAVPSEVFRIYDVYAYLYSGTPALALTAWDSGGQLTGSISGATNASPIVITTPTPHGLSTGNLIGINGCVGNTAPNGKIWSITVLSSTTFQLDGGVGNGTWTSGGTIYVIPTSRTTGLTRQDGVYVKSGNTTHRLLGAMMTTGTSGETECSTSQWLIDNLYWPEEFRLYCHDTIDSYNYSTATIRAANLNTTLGGGRVAWISCLPKPVYFKNQADIVRGAAGSFAYAIPGIGINQCGGNDAQMYGGQTDTNGNTIPAEYVGRLMGYHYAQRVETVGGASATTTWYGDAGGLVKSGMSGRLMA